MTVLILWGEDSGEAIEASPQEILYTSPKENQDLCWADHIAFTLLNYYFVLNPVCVTIDHS